MAPLIQQQPRRLPVSESTALEFGWTPCRFCILSLVPLTFVGVRRCAVLFFPFHFPPIAPAHPTPSSLSPHPSRGLRPFPPLLVRKRKRAGAFLSVSLVMELSTVAEFLRTFFIRPYFFSCWPKFFPSPPFQLLQSGSLVLFGFLFPSSVILGSPSFFYPATFITSPSLVPRPRLMVFVCTDSCFQGG